MSWSSENPFSINKTASTDAILERVIGSSVHRSGPSFPDQVFRFFCLRFFWDLEFGIWNFLHVSVVRKPFAFCCAFFLVSVVSPALLAQTVSSSRLSAHLINAYTAGSSNIIAGHPRVLKILDLGSDMLQAARAYKAGTPTGKIVLRIYTPNSYPITADPAVSATNFWTTILQPPLNALSVSDRALIDYLEGPNEGDSTPTWGSLQAAQWFTTFWTNLSPLIAAAGFKPCIGSIAVGNPPGK